MEKYGKKQASEQENEGDGDEKQNDDAKEYTWRKYGQKNASFDTAGWIKKFKPYCGKTTEKIIDGWLKMIESTMIREANPQTDQYGLTADDYARAKATKDNVISRGNPAADGKDSQDKGANDQSHLDSNDGQTSSEKDSTNPSDEKSNNSGEKTDSEKSGDEKTAGDEDSKTPDEEKSDSEDGKTEETHVNAEDKERGAKVEINENYLASCVAMASGIRWLLNQGSANNLDEESKTQLKDLMEVFDYITTDSSKQETKATS